VRSEYDGQIRNFWVCSRQGRIKPLRKGCCELKEAGPGLCQACFFIKITLAVGQHVYRYTYPRSPILRIINAAATVAAISRRASSRRLLGESPAANVLIASTIARRSSTARLLKISVSGARDFDAPRRHASGIVSPSCGFSSSSRNAASSNSSGSTSSASSVTTSAMSPCQAAARTASPTVTARLTGRAAPACFRRVERLISDLHRRVR
jgi:hypothetical protein